MMGEWTNHLWQSTVFAVAAGLLTLAFRKNRAQVRYWLWFSATCKFLIPFSLLIGLGSRIEWAPAREMAAQAAPAVALTMTQITQPFSDTVSASRSSEDSAWAGGFALFLWACGFATVALVRLRGWLRIRSAVRSSTPLDIPSSVAIRSTSGLLEPGVVGWLRPILLLPQGIEERLTPRQLEAVLAHELCHVRRRDNITASIHMLVEAVFWFHPLVWWIGARLVEERERACDEGVLSLNNKPNDYAQAIVNVCRQYVESPLACVAGISGSDLRKRIENIMENRRLRSLGHGRKLLIAVMGLLALIAPIAVGILGVPVSHAQSQSQFEVASIRPHGGPLRSIFAFSSDGPQVKLEGYLMQMLVQEAYNVRSYQVSFAATSSPPDPTYYNIMAKAEGDGSRTKAEFRQMLQALLADRFKLKFHREMKEMPVYALVVGKSGPKVKKSAPDASPISRVDVKGRNQIFTDSQATMEVLSEIIRNAFHLTDRPVVDMTGLTGTYDIKLEATPESRINRDPQPGDISIFTAAQEQLGLKLEARKAKVEVLVVDRMEKPSEN